MEPKIQAPMDSVKVNNYDPHIVPAETASRQEREGDDFKKTPHQINEEHGYHESPDTTAGYTVDREGLLNNYAVEPEMYYEVPGDAEAQEAMDDAVRAEEMHDVNEDKQGQLTMDGDQRGRGQGLV